MKPSRYERKQDGSRGLAVASRALSGAFLAVCAALAALMLVPALLGYERYVITSGSMTGTFGEGSLIFDERVPTSALQVGDVITYTPPPDAGVEGMITHRIVRVGGDDQSNRVYQTKGDANATADPWKFTLDGKTQARLAFHVPYVGYAFAALSVRNVRMLVIGGPALLIALAVMAGLVRDIRAEARERSGGDARIVTSRGAGP